METRETNFVDAIVKLEKINFAFVDINASKTNYEWVRQYYHNKDIFIGYLMYTDSTKEGRGIKKITSRTLPSVEDEQKVGFSGSMTVSNIDDVFICV